MRDITDTFKNAIKSNLSWSMDDFYQLVETIREKTYEVSFWENVENWATISKHGQVEGYLWSKYPVIFVSASQWELINYLKDAYRLMAVIDVEDLKQKEFQLNHAVLKDYLEEGVHYTKFSVSDLWFYTNNKSGSLQK
ncbi:MAG: hypothetical protein ACFB0B_09495 [Thermonemataceae bacterium]